MTNPGPEVHLISGARRAHSDDQDQRIRRYLISMAIRTVCVVLAVIVGGPLRWVFIAGAVVLPYIAVVMANAVGERRRAPVAPGAQPSPPEHIALPPASVHLLQGEAYITESGTHVTSPERVIHTSDENPG